LCNAFHYGISMVNDQAMIHAVVHLYNVLIQIQMLRSDEIPLLENLCTGLESIVFTDGQRATRNFASSFAVAQGGKVNTRSSTTRKDVKQKMETTYPPTNIFAKRTPGDRAGRIGIPKRWPTALDAATRLKADHYSNLYLLDGIDYNLHANFWCRVWDYTPKYQNYGKAEKRLRDEQ